jgi:hypothetical protein
MRSKKSIAIWHKRMEEIEALSKMNDSYKARKKRQRIQDEIDRGIRNIDGTMVSRLVKKQTSEEVIPE